MMKKYNHLYALGFSVDSDQRGGATADEVVQALRARILDLRQTGESLEAVGVPDETVDNETGTVVAVE